jgi:3-dehydroquinate dehydratase type I
VSLRICVSILPKTLADAQKLVATAEAAHADFVEVRMDYLKETQNLKNLTANTKIPLIAATKLLSEKGFFSGSETQRQQTLLDAAKNGFEYVDVDLSSSKHNETIAKLKGLGAKIIVSYHKFDGILTVSALERILDEQIASGADVCKIVLTAKQIEDNLSILSFVSFASTKAKLVCFCMGEEGKMSRLLSPAFGVFFTFASLEMGSETAAGQLSIADMKAAYKLLGIKS